MKELMDYQITDEIPGREWTPCLLQLREYAEVSGDFNPIHLDENYAKEMGLEGVIAHGMLTMAQMGVMLTEWVGQGGTVTQLEARFEGMVHPREQIRFAGFVKERTESMLICELGAYNPGGKRVLSGLAHVAIG